MSADKLQDNNLFDELGLEVTQGEVEVGKTYPIFGIITELLNEEPGNVIAKINYNITAHLNVTDPEKIHLLKQRAFESGIFVAKIVRKEPEIEIDCQTVIFGKQQAYSA